MGPKQLRNVLSLFDGIGGTWAALDRAGISASGKYASEVNPHAVSVVRRRHPDVYHIGDIRELGRSVPLPENVDLLCGGFPCKQMSGANATDRSGLGGADSSLFYEIPRILDRAQPRGFVIENVIPRSREQHDSVDRITEILGVSPQRINAADFSGQSRDRLFWTNLDIPMWGTSGRRLADSLLEDVDPRYFYSSRATDYMFRPRSDGSTSWRKHGQDWDRPKSRTLTAVLRKGAPHNNVRLPDGRIRRLTPEEVEDLFGYQPGYTSGIPETARYEGLGNSFSVPVMSHILQSLVR